MRKLTLPLTAYTFDIDFAGHVSNLVYLRWTEMARMALLEEAGLPLPKLKAAGLTPTLARTEIDYRRPILLGDPVELEAWLAELRGASCLMRMDIRNPADGVVYAQALQTGVFVQTSTGRPARITPELREAFSPWLESPG